jgi:hypothetical protein
VISNAASVMRLPVGRRKISLILRRSVRSSRPNGYSSSRKVFAIDLVSSKIRLRTVWSVIL